MAEIGKIHSYVLTQHGPDEALVERMARYAFGVWSQGRSAGDADEFRRCYGDPMPEGAGAAP